MNFREIEQKYENNELPPEARRQFDEWLAAQALGLKQGVYVLVNATTCKHSYTDRYDC